MGITHAKVSAVAEGTDPSKVRTSDWNADHVIAAGTITDTEVAAANKDGAAGTASMRTLGSGAAQAAAGNHNHGGTYATPADVAAAVAALVNSAPGTLDTLEELADALGDDPNFAATVATALGLKVNTSSLAAVALSGSASDLGAGSLPAARMPALTGDVTTTVGAVATTIAARAVSLGKLVAATATSRVLARKTAGTGDFEECTAAEVLEFLSSTRGSLLYRGASAWAALAPGATVGSVLTSAGTGADPTWSVLPAPSRILKPPGLTITTASGSYVLGSSTCPAWYIGRAPAALSSLIARFRVTVNMSGITWAEMFLATGTPTMGANPTLSVIAYTDISGQWNGTGIKDTTLTAALAAGTDFWIGAAKLSTGSPTVRGGTIGDEMICGFMADAGNVRPSTLYNGGSPTPTTFTVAANTTLMPWFVVQV